MSANTIIGALLEPGLPFTGEQPDDGDREDAALPPGQSAGGRIFKIRGADSAGQRSSANILIRKRYAWRGYGVSSLPPVQLSSRITLTATDRSATIGTVTVGIDGSDRLQAEDTFPQQIEALRAAGRRLSEFTKLAIDTQTASHQVLASLFHVGYLLAHRLRGCDMLVVEVNPRHVGYYRRLLDFTMLAGGRVNEHVGAPSVLLGLDLHHAREQIARLGGRSGQPADQRRSLYSLCFSAAEESGIVARMQRETW